VDYETWLKYKTGGQTDFIEVGLPFLVQGKNIKDPILVVSVLPRKKVEAEKLKQESMLQQKAEERIIHRRVNKDRSYYFWNKENFEEMPDGDYYVTKEGVEEKGPYSATLSFAEHSFPVEIPRHRITELEYPISTEIEEIIEKDLSNQGFSKRVILRKIGAKFILIRHKSIEKIVESTLRQTLDTNSKIGQNHLTIDQLPAGKYKVLRVAEQYDKDIIITIRRGYTNVDLLIPQGEKILHGDIITNGFLIHKQGLCYFEPKTLES